MPRLVPINQTGISAFSLSQEMSALRSCACSLDWRNPDKNGIRMRSDGASTTATVKPWSANNSRVRTTKLFSPHRIDPFGKICKPPCPPASKITAALGLAGVRASTRKVTPGRVGKSSTCVVVCAHANCAVHEAKAPKQKFNHLMEYSVFRAEAA